MTTKKPVKVFNCGPVQLAIWLDSKIINGTMVEAHSIKIDKSYKDGNEWNHTNNLVAEDLLKVSLLAMEAYKYIRLRSFEQNDKSTFGNHEESPDASRADRSGTKGGLK